MSGISRRNTLAGIVVTAAVVPTVSHAGAGIGDLWEQRQAIADRVVEAVARDTAAREMIPLWALPGPANLNSDGEYCGRITGAPLNLSIEPPEAGFGGVYKNCRVSFGDVRERFEFNTRLFPHRRAVYRAHMREHFRKLIPLYRAQAAEYRRAGITEIEREVLILSDAQWDVEQAIRACSASPSQTAASILIEVIRHGHATDTIETDGGMAVAALALAALRPNLFGLLAEHVAGFLHDQERPLSQMPFYGA